MSTCEFELRSWYFSPPKDVDAIVRDGRCDGIIKQEDAKAPSPDVFVIDNKKIEVGAFLKSIGLNPELAYNVSDLKDYFSKIADLKNCLDPQVEAYRSGTSVAACDVDWYVRSRETLCKNMASSSLYPKDFFKSYDLCERSPNKLLQQLFRPEELLERAVQMEQQARSKMEKLPYKKGDYEMASATDHFIDSELEIATVKSWLESSAFLYKAGWGDEKPDSLAKTEEDFKTYAYMVGRSSEKIRGYLLGIEAAYRNATGMIHSDIMRDRLMFSADRSYEERLFICEPHNYEVCWVDRKGEGACNTSERCDWKTDIPIEFTLKGGIFAVSAKIIEGWQEAFRSELGGLQTSITELEEQYPRVVATLSESAETNRQSWIGEYYWPAKKFLASQALSEPWTLQCDTSGEDICSWFGNNNTVTLPPLSPKQVESKI